MNADSFNIGDLVKRRSPSYSKDFGFIVDIEKTSDKKRNTGYYMVQWFTYKSPLGYRGYELVKVS
jgi:hypothetical protein